MSESTLYDLLEVSPAAGEDEIRAALARQSAKWSKRVAMASSLEKRHEAEVAIQRISEARRILLDPPKRQTYDAALDVSPQPSEPQSRLVTPKPESKTERATPWEELIGKQQETPSARHETPQAETVPCPVCRELIRPSARKCRWCGEWLVEEEVKSVPQTPPKPTLSPSMPSAPISASPTPPPPHLTQPVSGPLQGGAQATPAPVPPEGCWGCAVRGGGYIFWAILLMAALRACLGG